MLKLLINIGSEVVPTRSLAQCHDYPKPDFGVVYVLQETEKSSRYMFQHTSCGRFSICPPCPSVEQIDARRTKSEHLADWLQGLHITRKRLHRMQIAALYDGMHDTQIRSSNALQANYLPAQESELQYRIPFPSSPQALAFVQTAWVLSFHCSMKPLYMLRT